MTNKANWRQIDIRYYAVAVSLLLSVFTILVPDTANGDSFVYIRTAEIFLADGLASAFEHYSWATYSILIAVFSYIGFDLFTAAYALNAVFYCILVYAFISIVYELDRSETVALLAAVCVLVYPQLNEYRYFIIRDIGFWALSLFALWQLMLYAKNQQLKHALIFCSTLLLAALFRVEALAYLVFSPLALLFDTRFDKISCRRQFFRLVLVILSLSIAALAFLLFAGLDITALFLEFISTYSPFIESTFNPSAAATSEIGRVLFGEHAADYSGEYISVFILTGLLSILVANLFNAIGGPYLLVLLIGVVKKQAKMSRSVAIPVISYLLINLAMLFVFLIVTRYLSSRYAMLFCLLLALMVPLILAYLLQNTKRERSQAMAWLILFLAYCAVDSYYSFGESKEFVTESVQWIEENSDESIGLVTNSRAIAYFTGKIENYDQVSRYLTQQELRSVTAGDLIAIEMSYEMTQILQLETSAGYLSREAVFSREEEEKLVVYRRTQL